MHQLMSQTTQYLDSLLLDLLQSEQKLKLLEVPRVPVPHSWRSTLLTKTVLGTRNSAVADCLVWNTLPANIRSASVSLQTFVGRLKTHLFEQQGQY